MSQLVLLFTAIALIFGAIALGGEGETSNAIWIIFFGSAAAAAYLFWRNRGEGRGSSRGYGPTSNDADDKGAATATPETRSVGFGSTSNDPDDRVL